MLRHWIQFLVTTGLVIYGIPAVCQVSKKEFFFEHYGSTQGLYTRAIRSIAQSGDGFIWLATNDGLVRYDGENFTLFFDPAVPQDISNNRYIDFMVMDEEDRIWMANHGQLVIYHIHGDEWLYLRDDSGPLIIHPLSISMDRRSKKWWVGCKRGLYEVDSTFRVTKYPFREASYQDQPYHTVLFQNDTSVWMGNTYGYYRLNPQTGSVTTFQVTAKKDIKLADFFNLYLEGDSILWLGSWGSGLTRHDLKKDKPTAQYYFSDPHKDLNAVFRIIPARLNGDTHWYWVGTTEGLQLFDSRTGKFITYQAEDSYDHKGVPGLVHTLFEDKDHAVWLGGSDGLFRFDAQRQGMEKIRFPGLDKCFSIGPTTFEKKDGEITRIWFTIPYCGWHIYDLKSKQVLNFPEKLQIELKDVGLFDICLLYTSEAETVSLEPP